jgi:hypothetical protein
MTMSFNGGGPTVVNNEKGVQGQGVYKNVVQDTKGQYYDLSDPQSAAAYAKAMAAYTGPVEVRADGSQWTPDGKQISGPSKDNTATPGTYTRTPEGSLTSQHELSDDELRKAGLGQYAPTNSYGTGAGQYAPLSGPSPTGGVTDPRLGTNYTGEAIDPWSYGSNGGVYKNGQYVPGSNGFDQRSGEYNAEAAQRYADYNNLAAQSAYDTATGDTTSALALEKAAAEGNAPSQAEMLARQQLNGQLDRETSLAASARGGSLNQFAALEMASRQGASDRQNGLASIDATRAKEMADARGQYAGTATTMSAQQLQAELANRQRQLAAMGMADAAQMDRQKQADAIQQLGMSAAQAKAQLVTGQATQTSIAANQVQASKDIASQQSSDSLRNTVIGGGLAAGGAIAAGLIGSAVFGKPTDPNQGIANSSGGYGGGDTGKVGSGSPTGDSTGTGGSVYGAEGQAYDPYADPNMGSDMNSKRDIVDLDSGRGKPVRERQWYDDMAPATAPALDRYGENRYDDRAKQHGSDFAAQIAKLKGEIDSQREAIQNQGSSTDSALSRYGDPPIRLTQSTAGERSGGGGPWERSTSDYGRDDLSNHADSMARSIAALQSYAQSNPQSATQSALDRYGEDEIVSDERAKQDVYRLGLQHGAAGVNTLGGAPNNTGTMSLPSTGVNTLGGVPSNTGKTGLTSLPSTGVNTLGGAPVASGTPSLGAAPTLSGTNALGGRPFAAFASRRSAWGQGGGGDILSDNRAKLRDAYILGRAHENEGLHGGHPDYAFQLQPGEEITDHEIDPKKVARRRDVDRRVARGQAVEVSDDEAREQMADPRSAPVVPTTYYRDTGPSGIAGTLTAPRAADKPAAETDPNYAGQILSDKRAKNLENEPMAKANRALRPSAYSYKDGLGPPDQEPGEKNVGPMAQNLAADPVASVVVRRRPNGLLALNRDKLVKLTAGGVGYLQERVDDLEKTVAMLKAKSKGKR